MIGLFAYLASSDKLAANLIDQDSVYGPDTIIFDTQTHLRWLDLSITLGLSYDLVSTQFGPGGQFPGFRYATTSDIVAFFSHAGIPFLDGQYHQENYAPAAALIADLLGPDTLQAHGVLGEDAGLVLWTGGIRVPGHYTASLTLCQEGCSPGTAYALVPPQAPSWADFDAGSLGPIEHWLVRDIPEPSTALLSIMVAVFAVIFTFGTRNKKRS